MPVSSSTCWQRVTRQVRAGLAVVMVCWHWIATTMANGQKASNGYQAMAELDTNGDGVLNSKDSLYGDLRVWVDANADGVSESGELKSLQDLGITQLNLDGKQDASLNNGNIVGATSTYQTADGQTHAAADVWFQMQAPAITSNVSGLAQAIGSYGSTASAPDSAPAKLDLTSTGSGNLVP